MGRIVFVFLAFLLLTGFSEQDALNRFSGGWQMADDLFGVNGAIQLDATARSMVAVQDGQRIAGTIEAVEIVGTSAVFTVAGKKIILYAPQDPSVIQASIDGSYPKRYIRVP